MAGDLPEIQMNKIETTGQPPRIALTASQPGIANLVKALCAARPKFGVIKKTAENPFYKDTAGKPRKYADLAELISATADVLATEGVYLTQAPFINDDQTVGIVTLLAHTSGEWLEATISGCPAFQKTDRGIKFDAQTIGIGFTYLARYGLRAALNLGTAEDDDGNGLVSQPVAPKTFTPRPPPQPASSLSELEKQEGKPAPVTIATPPGRLETSGLPTKEELAKFGARLKSLGQNSRALKNYLERKAGVEWKDIPKQSFESIVGELEVTAIDGNDAVTKLITVS